jgi:hypothetical protein
VPKLTLEVLNRWGEDKAVFSRFCIAMHQLQVRSGGLADNYAEDAELAEHFLLHDSPVIRKWAEQTFSICSMQAEEWRLRTEDLQLPN